jgi:hypothetical protein
VDDELLIHPGLKVRPCQWGLGVFASELILGGSIIEECHYLKMRYEDTQRPPLDHYVYRIQWDPNTEEVPEGEWGAVILGFGLIYNHSPDPNAHYYRGSLGRDVFVYYALRDIQPGEQICVSYGEEWWARRKLVPGSP